MIGLDGASDEAGPAGLMRGAETSAVVAMEIFVEEEIVAEVGIGLEFFAAAEDGAAAGRVAKENVGEAAFDFAGDFEEGHLLAGAGGALDGEVVAEVAVVDEQGTDDEEIDGEPDGTAPIGIAAEHAGFGFSGLVLDDEAFAVNFEDVGIVEVMAGEGADAVVAEEAGFIEHAGEDAAELVFIADGEEGTAGIALLIGREDIVDEIGMAPAEIGDAFLEALEAFGVAAGNESGGAEGKKADHGADLDAHGAAIGEMEEIVEEAVLGVPEFVGVVAGTIHGAGDPEEVAEFMGGLRGID